MNGSPLMRSGLPFLVSSVMFDGFRVSMSVPMPGSVNGGAV